MPACVIYTTAASENDADAIATHLVERRLVACVNIIAGRSVYRWDGAVTVEAERYLLCKTTDEKRETAMAAIAAVHPYDIPCITSWAIDAGAPSYLDWIGEQTTLLE